ncbi:MAG: hypothetical protein GOV15_03530 [Candidatus Diapherotrites archaeon]|nr:hypothetical protein [Candidatus Diapherotrites archaeon]
MAHIGDKMKVAIVGSWKAENAASVKEDAEQIGKALAERGHTIVSGAGTGISALVVNAYRENKGKKYIAYLPSKEEREKSKEELGPEPDELVDTNTDYPERNIIMMRNIDVVIALHGGVFTLTEIIHASKDYKKKVAVIDNGKLASWINAIEKLRKRVLLTTNIQEALDYLED